MNKINELKEKREDIFKKINDLIFKKSKDLQNIINNLDHIVMAHYTPDDKMWSILLEAKYNIEKEIENEAIRLFKEINIINMKLSKVKQNER